MKNIRFSKTFSIIIIMIVSSVFLIPNVLVSIKLKKMSEAEDRQFKMLEEEQAIFSEMLNKSVDNLGVVDANLEQCLRRTVDEYKRVQVGNAGRIQSVAELTMLTCRNSNISSIDGLQNIPGLDFLDLSDNNIADIGPLKGLVNLKTLYLAGNKLSDVKDLQAITSLRNVSLSELNRMFCADVVEFIDSSQFQIVGVNRDSIDCVGGGAPNHREIRLMALKRSGVKLSREEETIVLEYEINQRKREYNRKHKRD